MWLMSSSRPSPVWTAMPLPFLTLQTRRWVAVGIISSLRRLVVKKALASPAPENVALRGAYVLATRATSGFHGSLLPWRRQGSPNNRMFYGLTELFRFL